MDVNRGVVSRRRKSERCVPRLLFTFINVYSRLKSDRHRSAQAVGNHEIHERHEIQRVEFRVLRVFRG